MPERRKRWRNTWVAGFAASLALIVLGYKHYSVTDTIDYTTASSTAAANFTALSENNSFQPLTANISGLVPRPDSAPLVLAGTIPLAVTSALNTDISFSLTPSAPLHITVRQFYFPGWHVTINGVPTERCPATVAPGRTAPYFCYSDPNGLIDIVLIKPAPYEVRVWYEADPDERQHRLLTILGLAEALLLIGLAGGIRKKR